MASSAMATATIRAVKGRKIIPTRAALSLVSIPGILNYANFILFCKRTAVSISNSFLRVAPDERK